MPQSKRLCRCGKYFTPPTKHKDQQSCNRNCPGFRKAVRLAAQRRSDRVFRERVIEDLRFMSRGQSLKERDIVEWGKQVWIKGYRAGHRSAMASRKHDNKVRSAR